MCETAGHVSIDINQSFSQSTSGNGGDQISHQSSKPLKVDIICVVNNQVKESEGLFVCSRTSCVVLSQDLFRCSVVVLQSVD